MTKAEVIKQIEEKKIIVVTRGIFDEELVKLAKAMLAGGISMFEITYDPADPDTLAKTRAQVELLRANCGDALTLGIGTVLTVEQAINAAEAGADFIVSPNFNPDVVKETLKRGIVSMPGCMTPTEICAAHDCGADFIKFFPAGTLGIKYCKDIYAPIHHVKYIATVGVTEETFEEYLKIGFVGAGISSMLVDKKLRAAGNWEELTNRAKRFVAIAERYK